jgi:SAM-dependent methyltransferase
MIPSEASPKLTFEERILFSLARRSNGPNKVGSTANYTLDNCLVFARKAFADFDGWVRGRTVLDHGCGFGWQSVAMRVHLQAAEVFGVDIGEDRLAHARDLARRQRCADRVQFGCSVPGEWRGRFDVVLSLSAFEHYADPVAELESMCEQVKPGGVILLGFAEPWWSPHGSHLGYAHIPGTNFTFPWLNLFFSERALLRLRSQFRTDHATHIEEVDGGLNRMSVSKFEKIISRGNFLVEQMRFIPVKGLPLVTRLPLLRELLTSAVSCVLRIGSQSRVDDTHRCLVQHQAKHRAALGSSA